MKKIAITGAAGQIAYSLIFRLLAGELLGKEKFSLHLLEIPPAIPSLEGVVMEIEDCASPYLENVVIGSDPKKVFEGVDIALLVGAMPRGPGMERKDLLSANSQIFVEQGRALHAVASKEMWALVVGNPCNTNALITHREAPGKKIFAMMSLDENRAKNFLAKKAGVALSDVSNMTIWGNHSATQVPDFVSAKIKGKSALDVIEDRKWCEETFIPSVQKRGAAVIAARGKSSAASAANAVLTQAKAILVPTPKGETFSCALLSDQNPYGIQEGLIFSFPCTSKGEAQVEIVPHVQWDSFIEKKIRLSEKELLEEREMVS